MTQMSADKPSLRRSAFFNTKKRAKGDPAALQLTDVSLEKFVGEEAPVARTSAPLSIDSRPRNPDAFYRGEEAGAAIKTYRYVEQEKFLNSPD